MTWKPKLTPAKLRALAFLVEHPASECSGYILTSCHALEQMDLVEYVDRWSFYEITAAGRKALADPASYKPRAVR